MTDDEHPLRIVVLVSEGRHPVSGVSRWSRNDARALSLAYSVASGKPTVQVLHAGHDSPATRDYLALGVNHLDIVPVAEGVDVVDALEAHVHNADLILCGLCAEGQEDSGMVPYLLAQRLGLPLLPSALDLAIDAGGITIGQFLPKGRRRRVTTTLPCVVTVHPMAPLTLKYAYAGTRTGTITTLPHTPIHATGQRGMDWTVSPINARPIKLAAHERRSGHARMLSATTTESRAGVVVDQGSAQEKATAVITYLRKHGLIDY
ncbi:MAG TPA: electron transfer flavoprotein subunit beta/FixA family protein [Burkholderiaceae bacterium]|nr:electron transfer flavoprotein subunit beta/FixA family protein [Burkholderiaceae bacterium]